MELPVQTQSKSRAIADVRAMAIAVQANLMQLKVVDARNRGIKTTEHEIKIPAPGTVHSFRETLITPEQLRAYQPTHIQLRLHEIWGQFCLMHWVFHVDTEVDSHNFALLPHEAELRCDAHLSVKHDEIHAFLWRLKHEQLVRSDTEYAQDSSFQRYQLLAAQIPAVVLGKTVTQASDEEIFWAACEHAGMLAAIRWIMDRNRTWAEQGIMDVGEKPF